MTTPPDDIPPAVPAALTRLWDSRREIHLALRPRDAFIAVGLLQLATRHPQLPQDQRRVADQIGRVLHGALAQLEPAVAVTLEDGWNPATDVPNAAHAELERLRAENAAYRQALALNNLEVEP